MNSRENQLAAFDRLLNIMDDLREKCPWDQKQTYDTLRMLTIEEVYELSDAILKKDSINIKEEIGDLMLHMVFYAKIGCEEKSFDIADALNAVCDKLIKRHPHIYGDVKVNTDEDVKKNWEQLKLREGKKSVLSGVPDSLPSMIKAYRMQDKTAQVGFEWPKMEDVWEKVKEEIQELETAQHLSDEAKIEEEFGDVLFSLINYARYIRINPDSALERVNIKFKRRFEYIEANAPKSLMEMTLDEMDYLWEESKKSEKSS
jgi:XTP/dITP diphosphohydrolase